VNVESKQRCWRYMEIHAHVVISVFSFFNDLTSSVCLTETNAAELGD
jgi:hypothetical protein